ncbi:DUF397 domain-containing protein [Streptomyces sp. NPDC050211]
MLNGWRTSSYNGNEGGNCLEVLDNKNGNFPS